MRGRTRKTVPDEDDEHRHDRQKVIDALHPANATPVQFNITSVILTLGTSYETTRSLLNVQYDLGLAEQTYPSPGSQTFQVGTVDLVPTALDGS
jgi:hypothetical protein